MFPDFSNIDFLQRGSPIQQIGWKILNETDLMKKLSRFNPVLIGTLPLDIFIEGKSDIDISCEVFDVNEFMIVAENQFHSLNNFSIRQKELGSVPSVIVNFELSGFPVELVGQPIPVMEQVAVKHLLIEFALLQFHGKSFREKVLELKVKGMKTEPAFAALLNLSGDPYQALLMLDSFANVNSH